MDKRTKEALDRTIKRMRTELKDRPQTFANFAEVSDDIYYLGKWAKEEGLK